MIVYWLHQLAQMIKTRVLQTRQQEMVTMSSSSSSQEGKILFPQDEFVSPQNVLFEIKWQQFKHSHKISTLAPQSLGSENATQFVVQIKIDSSMSSAASLSKPCLLLSSTISKEPTRSKTSKHLPTKRLKFFVEKPLELFITASTASFVCWNREPPKQSLMVCGSAKRFWDRAKPRVKKWMNFSVFPSIWLSQFHGKSEVRFGSVELGRTFDLRCWTDLTSSDE